MEKEITLRINGKDERLTVEVHRTLLEVLRSQLSLMGTREACGQSLCGSCTVLLNGDPVSACLTLAVQADGAEVTTVEGLGGWGHPHKLQEIFREEQAFQCGYCTPGMLLSTMSLVRDHPDADDDTIRTYLSGNICRCGAYDDIFRAVKRAMNELSQEDMVQRKAD